MPIVADNSILSTVRECEMKAWLSYCRHLTAPVVAPYFVAGTAAHAFLESWHQYHDVEAAVHELEQAFLLEQPDPMAGGDYRNLNYVIGRMKQYVANYGNRDPFTIKHYTDGTPGLEHSFAIEIESGYILTGRFDGLIEWNGNRYVMDHKTTSQLGGTYFEQFKPNSQMTGYWAAAEELEGEMYSGVMINAVQFAKQKVDFQRNITTRNERDLTVFRAQTMKSMALWEGILEFHEQWESSERSVDPFYNLTCANNNICHQYGGCPFLMYCRAGGHYDLSNSFIVKPWNPLERSKKRSY